MHIPRPWGKIGDMRWGRKARIGEEEAIAESWLTYIPKDVLEHLAALPEEEKQEAVGSAISHGLEVASEDLAARLLRTTRRFTRGNRRDRRGFERRLFRRWRPALELFDAVTHGFYEAGSMFNREERPRAAEADDAKFETLCRIHARACTTASEVGALLRSGHASGAHARWRTLHELVVVTLVLRSNDLELSERYLLHEVVESLRILNRIREHAERLGIEEVPTDAEVNELRRWRDELSSRYGAGYGGAYGWAHDLIGRDPTFADLEKHVGMDHWRPYYQMASHPVHANPKGAMWSVAAGRLDDLLLAGASNSGLADPGHQTLLSLQTVTTNLLTYRSNAERLLALKALAVLVDRAVDAFVAIQKKLDEEEAAFQRKQSLSS